MGDRGAAADDAPDQGLQGDVETGEVWYDAEKLDVNVGASERTRTTARRDGPTSQGRPSDMPASVLHQVRQQQGILQQMPQMRQRYKWDPSREGWVPSHLPHLPTSCRSWTLR